MVVVLEFVRSLVDECHHSEPSWLHAQLHCLGVSVAFVGSLYVLVPPRIRRLPRNHPEQIERRAVAVATVCAILIVLYPIQFCKGIFTTDNDNNNKPATHDAVSALQWLGIGGGPGDSLHHIRSSLVVLLHSAILFLGPLVSSLVFVSIRSHRTQQPWFHVWWSTHRSFYVANGKHAVLRNLVIAPFTEEVAFRACLVGPLLATGQWSPLQVSWMVPLWFGTAHLHHAYTKHHQQGLDLKQTCLETLVQFTYTTLFGAYVAHAFLRTASLPAIALCHSFCNYMSLPDLSVFSQPLYRNYQWIMALAYIVGIAGFVWGFSTLLPNDLLLLQFLSMA